MITGVPDTSSMQLTDKDTMGDFYEELLIKMAAAVKEGLESAERLYRQLPQEAFS